MKEPDKLILYIRISVEDEDNHINGKEESNSVMNQRRLLWDYVENNPELAGYEILEICDDGYSGTNLNRPGITKLLEMIREKQVSCVVVKDFSRFGRDYLTVSDYIDQIFPFMGVRFISINDHYDSTACKGATSGLDVAFRNVLYGYYSKDLSIKIKSGKRTKAENGAFMSPFAPIGYRKSPENRNQLLIEPEGADIVRKIFAMAGEGTSALQIARKLNEEQIPTPSQLKKMLGASDKEWSGVGNRKLWTSGTVLDILRDERYLGKNIYGRFARAGVGNPYIKRTKKEQWTIIEGCHEAIVSTEVFSVANTNIQKHSQKETEPGIYLFSKKLRCKSCGYALWRIKKPTPRYYCVTRKRLEECKCMKGHLKEAELAKTVLSAIKTYIRLWFEDCVGQAGIDEDGEDMSGSKKLNILQGEIRGLQGQKAALYERFVEQVITREDFQNMQKTISCKLEGVQQQYDELQRKLLQIKWLMETKQARQKKLGDYLEEEELTREMVEMFIDCIYVNSDKSIYIQWKFEDGIKAE